MAAVGQEQQQGVIGQQAAELEPLVDIDQLIRALDAASDHFPEQTLRACQQNRELVIPRLIEVLTDVARLGQEGVIRDGQAPFYALFLLGEFHATEALPALMAVLNLPNDVPDKIFGDAITEALTRVLASLAADRLDLLDALVRNPALNDYVRWSALDAFALLVRDQRLERHATAERLRHHLLEATDRKDCWGTTILVSTLATLNATDALGDMKRAFELDLVDESVIDMTCVEESLHPDQPQSCPDLDRLRPTGIANAVEELRGWHWPGDDKTAQNATQHQLIDFLSGLDESPNDSAHDLFPGEDYDPTSAATIHNDTPRTGRNDPCPCGSGKKYKKCCLRKFADS